LIFHQARSSILKPKPTTLKTQFIYRAAAVVSLLSLTISLVVTGLAGIERAGLFIILFFVALSISFQVSEKLKGYSYATVIFGLVTLALYYPTYLTEINGFKLITLIPPL